MTKNNEIDDEQLDALIAEQFPILDVQSVPEQLGHLIPLASKWGITDDVLRFRLLRRSSNEALERLIKTVRLYYSELSEWLGGPEAESDNISDEYIALSYLGIAADEAEIMLSRRLNNSNPE